MSAMHNSRQKGFIQIIDAHDQPHKHKRKTSSYAHKVAIYVGENMYAAAIKSQLEIWSYKTHKRIATLPGGKRATALRFEHYQASQTPKNRSDLLAAGYEDGKIRLWDFKAGKLKYELPISHRTCVKQIRFAQNREVLVSMSEDGEIIVWSLKHKKLINRIDQDMLTPTSMAFSPEKKMMAVTLYNQGADLFEKEGKGFYRQYRSFLAIWNLATGNYKSIQLDFLPVGSAFSTSGKQILLAANTGRIYRYSAQEYMFKKQNHLLIDSFQTNLLDKSRILMKYIDEENKIILLADDKQEVWEVVENEVRLLSRGKADPLQNVYFTPGQIKNVTRPESKVFVLKHKLGDKAVQTIIIPGIETGNMPGNIAADLPPKAEPDDVYPPAAKENIPRLAIFSPDGRHLAEYYQDKQFELRISPDGDSLFAFRQKFDRGQGVISMQWTSDRQLMLGKEDGGIELWNVDIPGKRFQKIMNLYALNQDDFILFNQSYYFGSRGAIRKLRYASSGIQFDLHKNRPDLILKDLGFASPDLIQLLKEAHQKRLKAHDLTDSQMDVVENSPTKSPTISFSSDWRYSEERDRTISIWLNSKIKEIPMSRLYVFVNDVPIFGMGGIPVEELRTLKRPKKRYRVPVKISLSEGNNEIQAFALRSDGRLTPRISYDIYYLNPRPSSKPNLYIAAIGMDDFDDQSRRLNYAAKDAQDLIQTYQGSGQRYFDTVKTQLFMNQAMGQVELQQIKSFFAQAKVDDQIILFVSSHGLIGEDGEYYLAMKNTDFSQPEKGSLSFHLLEQLLDGIACRQKLLLLDACHSDEYDPQEAIPTTDNPKVKAQLASKGVPGPNIGPSSGELVRSLFNELRMDTGATIISSSSGLQFSFEDDEYQNGVFTYVLLDGLRTREADENKDGQINVSEIQAYVAEQVPALTNDQQIPTFRRENLKHDFRLW